MRLIKLSEGETELLVPESEKLTKKNIVFYNPHMEFNRDVSVAVARILEPGHFCDVLAGSGARGIRIAKEVGCKTLLNDLNPHAIELIKRNAELNGVEVSVERMDANSLLSRGRFDFIDLDPFGTPVGFIDSALRSVENKGVLAVTATDTSALCGTYPRSCRRKYDSVSLRTDYYNELGLRILIGYVARAALKYDLCIEPLFSHCTRHYFRAYLRLRRSSSGVKKILGKTGYVLHCFSCLHRAFADLGGIEQRCGCGSEFRVAGPLWMGPFACPSFSGQLEDELSRGAYGTKQEGVKVSSLVGVEQRVLVPYYDIHKLFKKMASPVLPTLEIFERLVDSGYVVVRTHFSDIGLRTDAEVGEIYKILK